MVQRKQRNAKYKLEKNNCIYEDTIARDFPPPNAILDSSYELEKISQICVSSVENPGLDLNQRGFDTFCRIRPLRGEKQ